MKAGWGAVSFFMSRRICVEPRREELVRFRLGSDDRGDAKGQAEVMTTASALDFSELQPHIRAKQRREFLAKGFRDPAHPCKFGIVRAVWMKGFDAPSLHTTYLDKPRRAHGLMQAIARVNPAPEFNPRSSVPSPCTAR